VLEPDMAANLIAVDGDVLADITVLEHVRFVLKAGRVIKQELAASAIERAVGRRQW
jgi:imidazolonepropionase-like amidohydrolase